MIVSFLNIFNNKKKNEKKIKLIFFLIMGEIVIMVNIKVLKVLNSVTYLLISILFVGTYYSYENFLNITGFIHVVQKNETILTPDYYVFDIMFVILIFFFLSVLFQFESICLNRGFIEDITKGVNKYVKNVGFNFMLSGIFYIGWLINFLIYTQTSMIISTICMLISVYFGLLVDYKTKSFSSERNCYEIIFGSIPLSMFLGWNIILFLLTFTRAVTMKSNFDKDSIYIFYICILLFITFCLLVYLMNLSNYVLMLVNLYYVTNMLIKYYNAGNILKYGTIIDLCLIIFALIIKMLIDIKRCKRYKSFRNGEELNENLI